MFTKSEQGTSIASKRQSAFDATDGYGIKDARAATVEPNEQSTMYPTQMWSARRLPLQNIELMTQYDKFRFQLLSRPEAVTQHTDEQEADCNHLAIMFGIHL